MVQHLAPNPRQVRLGDHLDLLHESAPRQRESHAEHASIVKALGAGDASAARRAMSRHVVATERAIRASLVELSVRAEFEGDHLPAELVDDRASLRGGVNPSDIAGALRKYPG